MADFIIGKADSDVTAKLYKQIMATLEAGHSVWIIIPDQYVFETEKALYRLCRAAGKTHLYPNISVLTIAGISEEIIGEFDNKKPIADEIAKNVLMYRAVNTPGLSLGSLGRLAGKPGFVPRMVKTASLLQTAGILPENINSLLESNENRLGNSLKEKLRDIYSIYAEYDRLLDKNYRDRLKMTAQAARLAAEHGYFKDKYIFADGFNSFSYSQSELMRAAAENAKYACFAFVCDNEDKRDIFDSVRAEITKISGDSGCNFIPCDISRDMSEEIKLASEVIFSGREAPENTDKKHDVRIIRADDIYSETDFIAAEIKRLVREEGFRYNEIAVLCTDPSEYGFAAEQSFGKYEIPMFCDIPKTVSSLPLTGFVSALLKALDEPTSENLLNYVKNRFLLGKREITGEKNADNSERENPDDIPENNAVSGERTDESGASPESENKKYSYYRFTLNDLDCFDRYIYRWQLNGKHLEVPLFTDFDEKENKAERRRAIRAEFVRKLAIEPVLNLRRKILEKKKADECTGQWLCRTISDFLYDDAGLFLSLKYAEEESRSLWQTISEIFEAIYAGYADGAQLTAEELYRLFRDICAQTEFARPPKFKDHVLVGDTQRTRTEGIKAAFIAGADYGKFPADGQDYGLFSEYEANLLGDSLKLTMEGEELYSYNRYQAYRALTLPTKRIYLCYSLLSSADNTLMPSEIIPMLETGLGIDEENAADFPNAFYCSSAAALKEKFAAALNAPDENKATLQKALQITGNERYAKMLSELVSQRENAYKHKLNGDTAEKLFRRKQISATQAEKISSCRFNYFCTKGLGLKEHYKQSGSSPDMGQAVHYVMEKTLSKYCTQMDAFFKLTFDNLTDLSAFYLDEFCETRLGSDSYYTNVFKYRLNETAARCANVLKILQSEFKSRKYRPVLFELKLEPGASVLLPEINKNPDDPAPLLSEKLDIPPFTLKINDRITVLLTGIVDRADMFVGSDGKEYLRVMDYKSSSHEFDESNVLYGINSQMMIYLIALCEANSEIQPGGVGYISVKEPEITSKDSKKLINDLRIEDVIGSGMAVVNEATRKEMTDFTANFPEQSGYMGAKPEKKLIPKVKNTEEMYQKLKNHLVSRVRTTVSKLYEGDVSAIPISYKENGSKKLPCNFCPYKSCCGVPENKGIIVDSALAEKLIGIYDESGNTDSTADKPAKSRTKADKQGV